MFSIIDEIHIQKLHTLICLDLKCHRFVFEAVNKLDSLVLTVGAQNFCDYFNGSEITIEEGNNKTHENDGLKDDVNINDM